MPTISPIPKGRAEALSGSDHLAVFGHDGRLEELLCDPFVTASNVTLGGCCDHRIIPADEELHRHAAQHLDQADALCFGRVTYEIPGDLRDNGGGMAAAGRERSKAQLDGSLRPDDRHAAEGYVVFRTLDRFDWNAEFVRGI